MHKTTIPHQQKPCPQLALTDQVVSLQSPITSSEKRLSIQAFQKPPKPIESGWLTERLSSKNRGPRRLFSFEFWNKAGIKNVMPESLIMPDCCLASLAKSGGLLQDLSQLVDFLEPWHGISKYAETILQCLQKNSIPLNPEAEPDETLPS